ncbi:DinB family protein [Sanguibacter sp. A247]|uniref:DinB family protein n=1 Tax=unclassified Sanguibacter TaxID=2645534 RepID=UPI003FD75EF5
MSDDTVTPDGKDWTWVLTSPCPECGFDPARPLTDYLSELDEHVARWRTVLLRPDVQTRPTPGTWSPLEYACHVRDVLDVMASRALNIREEDNPMFPGWDQDDAAIRRNYAEARPLAVADELAERAQWFAQAYADVRDDEWERRGRRGEDAEFTLRTLGLYTAHELVHHAHDVGA